MASPRIQRRLIILGASNVTKSFSTLLATARGIWNEPLEVIAAHGHGRSYGAAWSRVLLRKLPGILPSGLWEAVDRGARIPTAALVTDIGNDLLYGFPVEAIAGWVEECLDRLLKIEARIVITGLPIGNISSLSEARYKFFRAALFPGCPLALGEITERARALDERVTALAQSRSISRVVPRSEWYGIDPIHILRQHSLRAWMEVCESWCAGGDKRIISRAKLTEWLYLRTRIPAHVKWMGWSITATQPSARLCDGTTVALY